MSEATKKEIKDPYLNVICLKCGKTITFQSVVPYSVDKVAEGWNLITDETNGEIISIRGSEIASICSQRLSDAQKVKAAPQDRKRKTKLKIE